MSMKFVIIQSAKAWHHELEKIFEAIDINAHSQMDVEGFMKNVEGNTDISNWFGSQKKPYDYMVSFTFLEEEKAILLLERIDEFNKSTEDVSPVNAYIVGVEKSV